MLLPLSAIFSCVRCSVQLTSEMVSRNVETLLLARSSSSGSELVAPEAEGHQVQAPSSTAINPGALHLHIMANCLFICASISSRIDNPASTSTGYSSAADLGRP